MKYRSRLEVAIVFPNGAVTRGLAIVTGKRCDGCATVTLPSQQVNFTRSGKIVSQWPEPTKNLDGKVRERALIATLGMAIEEPLEEWPPDKPIMLPAKGVVR
jgi:hypothetical protein